MPDSRGIHSSDHHCGSNQKTIKKKSGSSNKNSQNHSHLNYSNERSWAAGPNHFDTAIPLYKGVQLTPSTIQDEALHFGYDSVDTTTHNHVTPSTAITQQDNSGGATQNSIRVAQWMLQRHFATSYIGKDDFGKQLAKQATKGGVKVQYLVDDKEPTGTCACLITEKVRSLVANLGAANSYKQEHLLKPENWKLIEQAQFAYIAGFFLTVSIDSILSVGKHCAETNKYFMMNLSAPFITKFFKDQLMSAMPYIDILFGNESEAETLSESQEYGTKDLKEIALKVATLPKVNQSRPRIVIFTQGPGPVLLCKDGKVVESPIIPITEEDIVDTNGAGDAWVGGFLSQLVLGKTIEQCLQGGHYAANVVIKRSGCTFPSKPEF